MTTARLRPRAEEDLISNTRRYSSVGGDGLGERFFASAIASLRTVERAPGVGSPHIGELCGVPGLRSWAVKGFPTRWYYFITGDHIDIVRLLADAQDLVALLGDAEQ